MDKLLLDINDIKELTGLGEKTIRRLLANPQNDFVIKNGNRRYAHRELFEKYLINCAKCGLTL